MAGAALFTLVLIAVLVGATYLIQFAIWAFYVAAVVAVWLAQVVFGIVSLAVWGVWWLFQRDEATAAWRQANDGSAPAPRHVPTQPLSW